MTKGKAGAPQGNQNGIKLKDAEVRQLAYEQYCSHLAKGKSKRSFVFEHPEHTCTWQTMEKYMKDNIEFNPLQREVAECKGFAHWEQIVEDSAVGKNRHANTATLQMAMRNKYDWDKPNDKEKSFAPEYLEVFGSMMQQIANSQETIT